jgi:hypothetical protein
MVNANLTSPCSHCPFRSDIKPYLTKSRVAEIIASCVHGEGTFHCHKTLKKKEQTICAGAIIMAEREGKIPQLLRIIERLGGYDPRKMKMDSPVFKTPEAMIKAQRR